MRSKTRGTPTNIVGFSAAMSPSRPCSRERRGLAHVGSPETARPSRFVESENIWRQPVRVQINFHVIFGHVFPA